MALGRTHSSRATFATVLILSSLASLIFVVGFFYGPYIMYRVLSRSSIKTKCERIQIGMPSNAAVRIANDRSAPIEQYLQDDEIHFLGPDEGCFITLDRQTKTVVEVHTEAAPPRLLQ